MRKTVIKKFRKLFEEQKNGILYNDKVVREDFKVDVDDRSDELDQATSDAEQSMRMRLRNREMLYLKKIDEALRRIDDSIFGLCDACEEEIEPRRLMARPTATLCVSCKEDEEKLEGLNASGLRHKSMGETFRPRRLA